MRDSHRHQEPGIVFHNARILRLPQRLTEPYVAPRLNHDKIDVMAIEDRPPIRSGGADIGDIPASEQG